MQIPSYDLRIDGLTSTDVQWNIRHWRSQEALWSRKALKARKQETRWQYEAKQAEAATAVARHAHYAHQLEIRNTLAHLQRCRAARTAGYPVRYITDPAWLVEQAINRRAGWPEDPSAQRGSCLPVHGTYPRKASGTRYTHLRTLSGAINTPRRIVHTGDLGEWRKWLMKRLPKRFTNA